MSSLNAKTKCRKSRRSNKLLDRINMFENINTKPKKKKKKRSKKAAAIIINKYTPTNIENNKQQLPASDCNSSSDCEFKMIMNELESRNLLILQYWYKECNLNTNIISIDLTKLIIKYSSAKHGTFDIRTLYSYNSNEFGVIELKSDYEYEFDKVCIPSGSILTTHSWNPITKKGGTLLIESFSGGTFMNNGSIYGDKYLNILHLGSGGGSNGNGQYGGNGGGALKIKCKRFEVYGQIKVNGNMGGIRDGSRSGGSISIVCEQFKLGKTAKFEAKGGAWPRMGSPGGYGRIRINCNEDCIENECDNYYWIEPSPFIG